MLRDIPLVHLQGLVLAAILGACGGPDSGLRITLADDVLPADGQSETVVTVRAWLGESPVRDGTRITLSVDAGRFSSNQTSLSLSISAGQATATWIAPYERHGRLFEGEVTFVASYRDSYGQQQEARALLQMELPPPIDGRNFKFWCSAQNVGAPTSSMAPINVPCFVEARDVSGREVQIDFVRFGFLTEVGRMDFDRNGNLVWVLSPGERPTDVEPLGGDPTHGEPRWYDQNAGMTRNPRDGIATLVVYTRGRPTGVTDPLQGEPFVDENNDGQWNPGEQFFDANGNGYYDGPSGSTEDRSIWRWAKVMVSGSVSEKGPDLAQGMQLWDTGQHALNNIRIPRGGEVTISLVLVDENLNPIASHPRSTPDLVRVAATPSSVQVFPREQALQANETGLTFDQLGRVLAGDSRTGYLQGNLTYSFRIRNSRAQHEEGQVPWTIDSVEIRRIPYPDTSSQITERLNASYLPSGTLE